MSFIDIDNAFIRKYITTEEGLKLKCDLKVIETLFVSVFR